MSTTVFPFDSKERAPVFAQIAKLALVIGLHLALVAWVLHAGFETPSVPVPVRMEVRTLVAPTPKQPEPAPVVEPPKPRAQPPKPAPQAPARPVVRPAAPVQQPPVVTAAPSSTAAPSNFAVAPQPAAPARQEAPAAPAQAQAPVTAARFDADYLQNPAPPYPPMSRKLHEEGTVLLLVQVSAKGEADSVQIKQSCGFPRLDEAAMNAVRKWRFVPARRGSEAIAASVVVPIDFHLSN
ncbi:energy transducer TonB [Herbaspirillum sp. HC18]|nr:energy transducer TonB [Herbaspirillum sp. HC18]